MFCGNGVSTDGSGRSGKPAVGASSEAALVAGLLIVNDHGTVRERSSCGIGDKARESTSDDLRVKT
jgi:hypothetical protein